MDGRPPIESSNEKHRLTYSVARHSKEVKESAKVGLRTAWKNMACKNQTELNLHKYWTEMNPVVETEPQLYFTIYDLTIVSYFMNYTLG